MNAPQDPARLSLQQEIVDARSELWRVLNRLRGVAALASMVHDTGEPYVDELNPELRAGVLGCLFDLATSAERLSWLASEDRYRPARSTEATP